MPSYLSRYATPFTTGLFLVSAVSGIALFFHWGGATFHGMHEWLSMLLLVPFVLHLMRNWLPLKAYFRRPPMAIALALSLILALPFAFAAGNSSGRAGNPAFRLMPMMMTAPLADVAPILKTSPDTLVARLRGGGFTVASSRQSLDDIAKASGTESPAVLAAAMPPPN